MHKKRERKRRLFLPHLKDSGVVGLYRIHAKNRLLFSTNTIKYSGQRGSDFFLARAREEEEEKAIVLAHI